MTRIIPHSNARSIKTRIETADRYYGFAGIKVIRMQDPLKQGLKQPLRRGGGYPYYIRMQDKLKQG